MDKAEIISPEAMAVKQADEDIAMTAVQRLTLAFQISEFAAELHLKKSQTEMNSSSILWIDLKKKCR